MKGELFLLMALSSPAVYAEVSDKIATVPELWAQGVVAVVLALLLARWKIWAAVGGAGLGS